MSTKLTNEEFILRATKVHGDAYDYSATSYVNAVTKVRIKCKLHDFEFEIRPHDHLAGTGCRYCGVSRSANAKKYNNEEFINLLKVRHGDQYIYDEVKYLDCHSPVDIICRKHGKFSILPQDILHRSKCPMCTKEEMTERQMWTTEQFISKATSIHADKYDYSLSVYRGCHVKVKIICNKHKTIFLQSPSHHIRGVGCPICKESKGEAIIRNYLIENNIKFVQEYKILECRNKLPLPFDFCLELNGKILLIEFNGIQHYKSIKYFGGDTRFRQLIKRDLIKKEYCSSNNIPLLIIKYNQLNKTVKLLREFIISHS